MSDSLLHPYRINVRQRWTTYDIVYEVVPIYAAPSEQIPAWIAEQYPLTYTELERRYDSYRNAATPALYAVRRLYYSGLMRRFWRNLPTQAEIEQ